VSGERAFGEGVDRFEELARGLAAIGERKVKLEVRLGAAHGEPPNDQPGALGEREQLVGVHERRSVGVMHDHATGSGGLADHPFPRHAGERVPTGPAHRVERFESECRGATQHAADDERVAPAAAASERPHPWQIPGLEEDDHCHACERGLAIVYHHLYNRRAQPAHGGAAAEDRQAGLHPPHQLAPETDVPDGAAGKPGDDRDCENADELLHGGRHDSTPPARGWRTALREFMYGLAGYEIAQHALEIRASMETLFMLGVFGDMLGVPVLPPYYGLRVLPFVVPQIETWKRRCLRERELGSDHEHHLHGV